VTPPLQVDIPALEAAAREFAQLSDELSRFGTVHENTSAPDQPSGKAVSALIASADHMTGECTDKLLGLGQSMADAAKFYTSTDSAQAHQIAMKTHI
jgi:hypothetical protein